MVSTISDRRRKRGPAGKELVLIGSSEPKFQTPSARDWTSKKERIFLSVLAETCNVTRAVEAAGVSVSGAYARRQRNAAFRASWRDAIAAAYQRLELILLDRAFNGTEKIVTRKDGSEDRMREYSGQLGLQLLKMHRATAVEGDPASEPENIDELREKLFNKLERLRAREERSAAE